MGLEKFDPFLAFLPEPIFLGSLELRNLGRQPYRPVFEAMKAFTQLRRKLPQLNLPDQLWVVEHDPVYTLGHSTETTHLPACGSPGQAIEIVSIDRGGQITYHGPGQVVLYYLLDLNLRKQSVRWLVSMMERLIIDFLSLHQIHAESRANAPGVYVDGEKIAALGIKITRGCSYHGLAFNIDMDLSPFNWINPCGYAGMPVTQYRNLAGPCDFNTVKDALVALAIERLK